MFKLEKSQFSEKAKSNYCKRLCFLQTLYSQISDFHDILRVLTAVSSVRTLSDVRGNK